MPFAAFPNPAVKKNILYLKQTFQCYCHYHYGFSNFREIKICCSLWSPCQGVQSPPTKIRIQYTPMLKRTWMRNKTDGNTGMTQNSFFFLNKLKRWDKMNLHVLTFNLLTQRLCLHTSSTGADPNPLKPTVPYSGSSASNWRWQISSNSTVLTSCALNKNK